MHKTLLFITLLFIAIPLAYAQGLTQIEFKTLLESPLTISNDKKVESIFSSFNTHPYIRCNYLQTKTIKRLNRSIQSSGTMLFHKEKGLAWMAEKPFISTTVLTHSSIVHISKAGKRKILMSSENPMFNTFSQTIQSVFRGNYSDIKDNYTLYYRTVNTIWHIGLIPKDGAVKLITKAFELTGNDYLTTFKIYEKNGDEVLYTFSNHTFLEELTSIENKSFEYE
ncbi:MAG: outer membrane lipoprotein carrier protein LolA [Fibrobacterales bacterium]